MPAAAVVLTSDDTEAARTTETGRSGRSEAGPRGHAWGQRKAEKKPGRSEAGSRADKDAAKAERRRDRGTRIDADRAGAMAKRAQQHADGMKAWADCVEKAADDAAARTACVKPLPPGLAKRR